MTTPPVEPAAPSFALDARVDISRVSLDSRRLLEPIAKDRMQIIIEHLAESPRHVVDDHSAALAAATYVSEGFEEIGLDVRSVAAEALGVALPSVWSEIPGTDSDVVFVFVAHYDTVAGSPGADDNASGVAGLLEIARVLKANPLPVTTIVSAVGFEETGSFAGSNALAAALAADRQIIGMISLEMIGYTSDEPAALIPVPADFLAIVGDLESEALIHTFHSAAERWLPHRRLVPIAMDPEINTNVRRSDHAAFWAVGVPAAMATDTANFRNPHYHQPSDRPETIDYDFARDCTAALMIGASAYASLWLESGVPLLRALEG